MVKEGAQKVSYGMAVLTYGLFCQVGQALLFRELFTIFQGNELSFGIIFSVWLLWTGWGSRWQARRIETGYSSKALLGQGIAVALLLPLTLGAVRLLRGILPVPFGGMLSLFDILSISLLVMSPVCFLIGSLFVLLARSWREAVQGTDTRIGGKTYIAESVGTAIGGLGFSLFLVHLGSPFQIALGSSLLLGIALLFLYKGSAIRIFPSLSPLQAALQGTACIALTGLGLWLVHRADDLSLKWQWTVGNPDAQVLGYKSSRYGLLTVTKREKQVSVYQSGQILFTMAAPDLEEQGKRIHAEEQTAFEEQSALQFAHLSLLQHPSPQKVLLIGGGLRGTLRGILSHPISYLDYVELDPALLDLVVPYAPEKTQRALQDPRVHLYLGDGRQFLRSSSLQYDCIVLDLPDPTTATLNRFYTVEFFALAASRLSRDGVLSFYSTSTPELRGTAIANRNATLYHTLRAVFPRVLAVGEHTLYFFATLSAEGIPQSPHILIERFQHRILNAEGISPFFLENLYLEGPLLRTNWILHSHGREARSAFFPPQRGPLILPPLEEQKATVLLPVQEQYFINSDFRPIGYFHSLHFWSSLTRQDQSRFLSFLLPIKPFWGIPALFLPFLILFLLHLRGFLLKINFQNLPLRYAITFCVFTTGISTMSMQVALLFAFQTQYGFVYEMIGFITALFMIGLALGTSLSQKYMKELTSLSALARIQFGLGIFATLIGIILPHVSGSPAWVFVGFSLLTLFSGGLNGADFPLAAASLFKIQKTVDRATGFVYGAELWGACLGGLVAGIVLAPILGLPACFYFAALANITAFIILWIAERISHG